MAFITFIIGAIVILPAVVIIMVTLKVIEAELAKSRIGREILTWLAGGYYPH